MVKIIFSDVDGTLFDGEGNLSKTNIDACLQVQDKGIHFVVNSGRYGHNAIKIAKMLAVDQYNGFAIGNDGSEIWSFSEKKWIYLQQLDKILIKDLYEWLKQYAHDIVLVFNTISQVYVNHDFGKFKPMIEQLQLKIVVMKSESEIKEHVSKIIVVLPSDDNKINNFITTFMKRFPNLMVSKYGKNVFSIGKKNVTKGDAIKWLCNYLNVDVIDSMGLGDNFNDLSMLLVVGHPIIMGNGVEELKKLGDIVATNDENGVAQALNKILNIHDY